LGGADSGGGKTDEGAGVEEIGEGHLAAVSSTSGPWNSMAELGGAAVVVRAPGLSTESL
jgi:hypothetical protein